jgi:iron(III) transport system permease protein
MAVAIVPAGDSGSRGFADVTQWAALAVVVAVSLVVLSLLAVVLWLGWTTGSPGEPELTYTTDNFVEVFTDQRTLTVVIDTLMFSVASLIVALAFGIPAAWIAERTDFGAKTLIFTLMAIGLLIPGFAAAMGWLFLLHPRIGLVNQLFMQTFGIAAPFNIISIAGMGWVQGLNLAPLAFIMTAAVFRSMDPSLEEAAEMHGASRATVLRRVTVPLAWPGILAASIYIFMIGFAAFDVPAIIGWGNRLFTFSTYLYLLLNPQEVEPNHGLAAALSTVMIAIAGAASWWYATIHTKAQRYAVVTGKAYRPNLIKLSRRARLGVWTYLLVYFAASKLMPLVLLLWASLLPYFQLPSAQALDTVSLGHYAALPWDLMLKAIANTSVLAVLTPTVTLAISLAFSWIVLRSRLPGRSAYDFIAFLPHAVPNVVFGVGALLVTLFVLQRAVPIYGTLWILLIVFTISRISYGTRMTNSGLVQIHKELEESAQTSGATQWQAFTRVSMPLLAPTLLYAWLWIALLTFRELTLAVILSTSDNITFPVVVWSMWLAGGLGQASAVAIVMLAMMAPVIAIYWFFARRQGLIGT